MTRVRIVFYGRLAEAIAPQLEVDAAGVATVAELRAHLAALYPVAAGTLRNERSRVCVGNDFVSDDHSLDATNSVEFLPPVSGG